jgi:hypothetical protein
LRTKFFTFFCFFCAFLNQSFAQLNKIDNPVTGVEDYQAFFFNSFFYDDFSYRFVNAITLSKFDFGKKIGMPKRNVLVFSDTLKFDSLKAISNLYLVLGSQKNQSLQLENVQRIGKSSWIYLNYSSLATIGFLKNSFSRNRSFNLDYSCQRNKYHLLTELNILVNNDGCSGGITDSTLKGPYSKRDLQQLEVNLTDDYLKKKFLKINVNQDFVLLKRSELSLLCFLKNEFSKLGFSYSGKGLDSFYSNVNYDSSSTHDTLGYNWITNDLGFEIKKSNFSFSSSIAANNYLFQLQDSTFNFYDLNVTSQIKFYTKYLCAKVNSNKVLGNSFRKENLNIYGNVTLKPKSGFVSAIEFFSQFDKSCIPFTSQHYYSNHFIWFNSFIEPTTVINNIFSLELVNKFKIETSLSNLKNRVFLDETIKPVINANKEQIFSADLVYNDTIGKFHITDIAKLNNSSSVVYPVVPLQNFCRVGYFFSLFKHNLKAEAGVSFVYNDKWFASSYCPALDEFYLQSNKKYDGILVFNVFANFKIKSATLFLKMERINSGWTDENNFTRKGYPMPPRTLKFGLNWPMSN